MAEERDMGATDQNKPRQAPANRQPLDIPEREGGDDALADSSPADSRSDEKVIVNEQRSNKTVNAPSQTAANSSESSSYDDEIVDGV
jgi:hypothetical protein